MPSEVPLSTSLKFLPERTYIQHIGAQRALMPREVLGMTLVHSVLAMGDMGQAGSLTNGERSEKTVEPLRMTKKNKKIQQPHS